MLKSTDEGILSKQAEEEVNIHAALEHPNICRLLDFNKSSKLSTEAGVHKDEFFSFAMEWITGGPLLTFIDQTSRLSE